MNLETLDQAILEAARFVRKAKELKKAAERDRIERIAHYGPGDTHIRASKESGALRRASMDLTRILADLRNGR